MGKNNKRLVAMVSVAILSSIFTNTLLDVVSAKVTGIVVKDSEGREVVYDYEKIKRHALRKSAGKSSEYFDDFSKSQIIAYEDDVTGYIKKETIEKAAKENISKNKHFDIHKFTESRIKDEDKALNIKKESVIKAEYISIVNFINNIETKLKEHDLTDEKYLKEIEGLLKDAKSKIGKIKDKNLKENLHKRIKLIEETIVKAKEASKNKEEKIKAIDKANKAIEEIILEVTEEKLEEAKKRLNKAEAFIEDAKLKGAKEEEFINLEKLKISKRNIEDIEKDLSNIEISKSLLKVLDDLVKVDLKDYVNLKSAEKALKDFDDSLINIASESKKQKLYDNSKVLREIIAKAKMALDKLELVISKEDINIKKEGVNLKGKISQGSRVTFKVIDSEGTPVFLAQIDAEKINKKEEFETFIPLENQSSGKYTISIVATKGDKKTKKEIEVIYENLVLIDKINSAGDAEEIGNIIDEDYEKINLNLDEYDELTDELRGNVVKTLFERKERSKFKDCKDFKDAFTEAVSKAIAIKDDPTINLENHAKLAVEKAENSLWKLDYEGAKNLVESLKESSIKTELINRLAKVKEKIDEVEQQEEIRKEAYAAVSKAEGLKSEESYNAAKNIVDKLKEGEHKSGLLNRLEKVKKYIDSSKSDSDVDFKVIGLYGSSGVARLKIQLCFKDSGVDISNELDSYDFKVTSHELVNIERQGSYFLISVKQDDLFKRDKTIAKKALKMEIRKKGSNKEDDINKMKITSVGAMGPIFMISIANNKDTKTSKFNFSKFTIYVDEKDNHALKGQYKEGKSSWELEQGEYCFDGNTLSISLSGEDFKAFMNLSGSNPKLIVSKGWSIDLLGNEASSSSADIENWG